jgi:hypothetical protein
MRKLLSIILISIILSTASCSSSTPENKLKGKDVLYNVVYSQIIGFRDTEESFIRPFEEDLIIMRDDIEWEEFRNTHLLELQIPKVDTEKKSIIYIQVPWNPGASIANYTIEKLKLDNETLNISIKGKYVNVNSTKTDMQYKSVLIAAIDKASIPDEVKPILYIK